MAVDPSKFFSLKREKGRTPTKQELQDADRQPGQSFRISEPQRSTSAPGTTPFQKNEKGQIFSGGRFVDTPESRMRASAARRAQAGAGDRFSQVGLDKAPSLRDIQERERQIAQAKIDATEALFQENLADIAQRGKENVGITRAMSTGAGLAGTPFQSARVQEQQSITDKATSAERRRRMAEIAVMLDAGEQKAVERFEKERDAFLSAGQQRNEEQKALREAQRETITNLAKGGYSLDELPEEEFRGLLEKSGLSELEARSLHSLNTPEATANYTVEGNKLIGVFVDPQTGKPKVTTQEIEGIEQAEDARIEAFGGVPYVITKDADGNVTGKMLPGFQKQEEEDDLDERLSVSEAKALGVEYGTTRREALGVKAKEKPDFGELSAVSSLRKEFNANKVVQDFKDIDRSYKSLKSTEQLLEQGQSAPARDAITILFNKMLDPGSVVREGEFARTEDGQALITKAYEGLKKITEEGAGVSEKTLKDMVKVAETLHEQSKKDYELVADQFRSEASGIGIDPQRVVGEVGNINAKSDTAIDTEALRKRYEQAGVDDMSFEDAVNTYGEDVLSQILSGDEEDTGQPFSIDLSKSQKGKVLGLGPVTAFGSYKDDGTPIWQHGLDVDLKKGDPVPTPADGKVTFVGNNGGFGKQVRVQTADGNVMWFSHLDGFNVKVGDTVKRGQVVGKGGNTGNVVPMGGGDGSHLDFTVVKPDGTFYTPQEIFNRIT